MKHIIILLILITSNCIKNISNLSIKHKENDTDLIKDNIYGNNTLMYASHNGHTKIVELLVKRGVNANFKNNNRNTALMIAAYNGYKEIVEMLIEIGADFNCKNEYKKDALMIAAEKG